MLGCAQLSRRYISTQKPVNARFVTLPELRDVFKQEKADKATKEQAEVAKRAQKKTNDDSRMVRIDQDIGTKIFGPLSSCNIRDDFVTTNRCWRY